MQFVKELLAGRKYDIVFADPHKGPADRDLLWNWRRPELPDC